jgi:toxin FitB
MMIVDTNVLSEVMKPVPSERVLHWLASHPAAALYTTSITVAEVFYGIGILPDGNRRATLQAGADLMFEKYFHSRILPIDSAAARAYPSTAQQRVHTSPSRLPAAPPDGLLRGPTRR